jgi:hypothetical protein
MSNLHLLDLIFLIPILAFLGYSIHFAVLPILFLVGFFGIWLWYQIGSFLLLAFIITFFITGFACFIRFGFVGFSIEFGFGFVGFGLEVAG